MRVKRFFCFVLIGCHGMLGVLLEINVKGNLWICFGDGRSVRMSLVIMEKFWFGIS